ncbi:substrate-binding domain-containing protein [Acidisoma cellulosilytica]|uniref:Substrate-binding domain-containing protein n=1 Tax=Acidisoma cellulosilyticum TaxID=2802395 RepID=A0A963Z6F2_9PROT|nr:substrate-binding domain-containing protein [Acidisoma cellulosilyticum]MCB8882717.1 substrate-binding domain-containing protein [Acidisoma cellulosilyticum]
MTTMFDRRPMRGLSVAALALGTTLAAGTFMSRAAHADDACKPHKIELGNGQSMMGGCGQLHIALLMAATNNTHLQSAIKGAKAAAAKIGATIDVFDPNWSPSVQYNQAQNVISSGKYNAIVGEMNDGNQACKILTETAPEHGVLVAIANEPICNRAANEGDALWAPGTLNFVGGSQGRGPFRDWIMDIAKENPGPQKVAVVTGPDLNANTINTDLALKDAKAKYPDFDVVAVVRTDYSIVQGNSKTLPLFQAHPDLTILISNYSDMTRGAVAAAREAGALNNGKLKIYDSGGNIWAFHAVQTGQIESTRTLLPYTEMYESVIQLGDAWAGKPVPHTTPLDVHDITKANVDQFKAQY